MGKELGILMLCIVPVLVQAASQEVVLLPARPGKPSQIIYPDKLPPGVEYLIQYDGGESNYYLSGLTPDDTLGVFFKPPAACTLLEIHYCRYAPDAPDDTTYYAFAADVPDGFTLSDSGEYHDPTSMPGPSPVGSLFADGEFSLCYTGEWQWDTLRVFSEPDIGTDPFFAGYAIEDDAHSCRIDASVSPPFHSLAWKQAGPAPELNGPGWYSSWHLWWIRALVKIYWNIDIEIMGWKHLSDTYLTTERVVTANVIDPIGIPQDSQGVAWVRLHYAVDSGAEDTLSMVLVSGDSLDGIYSAAIPGVGPYSTVSYYITAEDYNGARDTSSSHMYVVREGTPGNFLLLIENDPYYGAPYSHDPVSSVASNVDIWDEYAYGEADSSVLYYYDRTAKGLGQPIIFWFTWMGFHFAEATGFLADFLDGGGKLFVSSEDLAGGGFDLGFGSWVVPAGHFLYDYMKAYGGLDDYHEGGSSFAQYGHPGDTVTGAINLSEITVYPYYWASPGNDWAGKFDQLDPACVPIFYDIFDEVMGYRYEDASSGYKIVWIYWPIHYIVLTNGDIEDDVEAQDTLIARTLDWFSPVSITFIRGDANGDMVVEMEDAIFTLRNSYVPGSPEPSCMDAADANDDGDLRMSDVIYTLRYLYVHSSPEPPPPFPDCGIDPTADTLGCESHPCTGKR